MTACENPQMDERTQQDNVSDEELDRVAGGNPPVVATNRAQLAGLVATNFLGENTPAIAATEAQYQEMWAQDVAAMSGYHGAAEHT